MKIKYLFIILFLPYFLLAQKNSEKEISKQQVLAKGEIITFIDNYYCNIFLICEGDNIESFKIIETDSKNPFSGVFYLENIVSNYKENKMTFSTPKIQKLLEIYISPDFSSKNGGEIYFNIYKDNEWKKEYLYILKNDKDEFKLYTKNTSQSKIVYNQIELISVFLKIKLNLSIIIAEHTFE